MQNNYRDFFTFSKKERVAIFLLLIISSLIWLLPSFFSNKNINPAWITITPIELEVRKKLLIERSSHNQSNLYKSSGETEREAEVSMFKFNPNLVSKDGLLALGLPERVVASIINYRSKGGIFKTPGDLRKIYGLSSEDANRIIPYAVIESVVKSADLSKLHFNKPTSSIHLDVNIADSTTLETLPGIGAKLSSRIVRYRERLSGFYTLDQLKEVYGINDSLYSSIKGMLYLDASSINKININDIGYDELSRHPYIGFSKAKLVIAYRKSHGGISSKDGLAKMLLLDSAGLERLLPYINY